MTWEALLDPNLSGRLCLTLLHSLWQVTLLAAVVWGLERLLRSSVEWRYAFHVTALIAGLLAMPITFAIVDVNTVPTAVTAAAPVDSGDAATPTGATHLPRSTVDIDDPEPGVAGALEIRHLADGPAVFLAGMSAETETEAASAPVTSM